MNTVKMYCYVVTADPRNTCYDTIVHCVCLSEKMAEQVCEKMNEIDRFRSYSYYEVELQK